MIKIRYYLFCIKWLYNHRNRLNTRQKFKAMENDWIEFLVTHMK